MIFVLGVLFYLRLCTAYPKGAPYCKSPELAQHGPGKPGTGGFIIKMEDDPGQILKLG